MSEQAIRPHTAIESISAVTLATHDMARAVQFYRALQFHLVQGGEHAAFTTFAAGASYLNLIPQGPDRQWSWWGRVIFHVADVDALYQRAVQAGFSPRTEPADAIWGERYFHITDPDGHELSFARPLTPDYRARSALTVTRVPVLPDGAEKRAVPRFKPPAQQLILFDEAPGSLPFPGSLIDYSEAGLGILIACQVAKGTRLLARRADAGPDASAAQLEVRYCISTGTAWRIGCRFDGTSRRIAMALLGLTPPPDMEDSP